MNFVILFLFSVFFLLDTRYVFAQADVPKTAAEETAVNPAEMREEEALLLFDDRRLLDAYAQKYRDTAFETLIQMFEDESLSSYQLAAAVRVFRGTFLNSLDASDRKRTDRLLLKCLNRSASALVQVEVMDTLVMMDRYKYFQSLVPLLIQKLDHYNDTVNELAFAYLNEIIAQQPERSREAQIVFNSINKILFLSRNHLTDIKEPGPRLSQKLKLLRWSIKILGTDDLDKLPKEVIGLL